MTTKGKETWSFIEQPQWYEGSLHNEFVVGKKSDYAFQLVPRDVLPISERDFGSRDVIVVVHLPSGVLSAAPFRSMERPKIEDTPNPIVGAELWTTPGAAGHFVVMADGSRYSHLKRRRAAKLKIRVQKTVLREAHDLATQYLERLDAGDLDLHPEPIAVPTRPGKMWLWSARWRELHADPEYKERPPWLGNDGRVSYLGSFGDTSISSVRS
jgi:hypothetical protein